MAKSSGLWAIAAVGAALIAAQGGIGGTGVAAASTVLAQRVGQQMTLNGVRVTSVPADEGFWVDTDLGSVWVQIDTVRESPYEVDPGDVVNVTGTVLRHGQDFPAQVGVTALEGGSELAAAGAHLEIPLNGITFTATS